MDKLSSWHQGPEFLRENEDEWPDRVSIPVPDSQEQTECEKELKPKVSGSRKYKRSAKVQVAMATEREEQTDEERISDLTSCESCTLYIK